MKIVECNKEFIMEEERDFDSAHASTLLECKNGDILASWFGGSWEKGSDVAIWVSKRQGGVWKKPVKVADERGVCMWNPVIFRKADNSIMLFYKVGVTISTWKTFVVLSKDEGDTWGEPYELVPNDESGGRGPVKNKPIRLKDGTVLAPTSLEGDTWDSFVDISYDDCDTWIKSELVQLRRSSFDIQMVDRPYDKHYCYGKGVIQPTLWQDNNGHVHMFLRSTSSRIFRSDSVDGGKTWSLAYATDLPNNNSGIDLVRLPNGVLVLAYNPTENLPNYYKGPRTPLSLSYSEDNGETFKELAVLENTQGGYAYPAIICNDKNEFFVTYTWKRERIVFWRFKYEE